MKVEHIIWLDEVEDKILRKHGLERAEVEEALRNKPRFRYLEEGRVAGEDVYAALSRTEAGRYITVVFILKPGNECLIVTARDMTRKERRRYGKK
jgi:hypothetical protein